MNTIESLKIEVLNPYDKNAKKHSKKQIKQVANSIKEFGWAQPLVVDKHNNLIIGHCRLEAAKLLKLKEVPVFRMEHLTDDQVKALRLADNKLNESEWDMPLVIPELRELPEFLFDLTGFDKDLIVKPDQKDNKLPDVPTNPITKPGDIYELGEHRIMCGDSTSEEDAEKLMIHKAEFLFTSPPYSDMRSYTKDSEDLSPNHLAEFIRAFFPYVNFLAVNLGIQRKRGEINEYWDIYKDRAKEVGYKFLSWNIWKQDGAGSIGKQTAFFPIEHEWIFVFGKFFKDINRTEFRNQSKKARQSTHRQADGSVKVHTTGKQGDLKELGTVLSVPAEKTKIRDKHPATFPVALAEKYILTMTASTDIVVDPFLGSGTTLIAAEKSDRICYGMEISPAYVDVIVSRWCEFTGNYKIMKNGKAINWAKPKITKENDGEEN